MKLTLGPLVALATTVAVSVLGIQGLLSGSRALNSALTSASSAHELEAIAAGVQEINATLYHVLTLRGAQTKGFNAAAELAPLLAESDLVSGQLRAWRDTRAPPAQRARVDALIDSVQRYKGAVDFVTQMLDVDFVAAVSFIRPFDRNFHDLRQSVDTLVREVQSRQRADADHALETATTTVRAFLAVGTLAVLLAVLAAADMARAAVRSHRLSRQNSLLTQMTQLDALTGVGNRRCFNEALERAWAAGVAQQSPLSLVMFDIDHFKKFNDSQGHQAGDECLRRVAAAVAPCARGATDTVARYGGEEFAIIMPNAPAAAGREVAERMRQAVLSCAVPHPAGGPPGIVTVSLGVACFVPTATGNPTSLIEAADKCLYDAKRGGRNRVGGQPVPEIAQPAPADSTMATVHVD